MPTTSARQSVPRRSASFRTAAAIWAAQHVFVGPPGRYVRTFHDRVLSTLADLDIDANTPLTLHNYIQGLGDLGAIVSLSQHRRIEDVRDAATELQGFLRRNSQEIPLAGVGALRTQSGSNVLPAAYGQHSGSAPWYGRSREQEGSGNQHRVFAPSATAPHDAAVRKPWQQSPTTRGSWNESAGQPKPGLHQNRERDQVEAMRRELEALKLQLMQQNRKGTSTYTILYVYVYIYVYIY